MDQFNFVLILMSIIIGLGVTELLTNVAEQIRERRTIKHYWLHSVAVVFVFFAFLQLWWESWNLRDIDDWSFAALLLMLSGPISTYLASHLIFPSQFKDVDMEAHYYENVQFLGGLAVLAVCTALMFRPLAFGEPLFHKGNISLGVFLIVFLALTFIRNKRFHKIALLLLLLTGMLDVLILKFVL